MSNHLPTFDDSYAPQKIEGVEAVEVISKTSARRHVIIHPGDGRVLSLDVKDYFVWEKLNGQSSLAQVKQDYYGKFKVLPTQHIIEIVRSWYEKGFLTDRPEAWRAQKEALKGWWGIPLPSIVIRNLVGPFASVMIHPWVTIILFGLTLLGLAGLVVQMGPLYLHQPFEELTVPSLIVMSILGMYLSTILQTMIRLGGLWKGRTYRNDRIILGAWMIFPGLAVGERGLELKPFEQLVAIRILEWLAPLMVSVALALMVNISPVELRAQLMAIALGAAVSFIMNSCPFLNKTLVKALESIAMGVRMRELREAFSKNALVFVDDYGVKALRVVKIYMASLMVWVVVGSSFLLYTMMRIADLLGLWGRSTMGLGDTSFKIWQILVYAPILIGFFWMLWKLIEPLWIRLRQYALWKDEQLLVPTICLLVLMLVPAQFVFTPMLLKCGLGILLCALFAIQWAPSKRKGIVSQVWPIVLVVLLSASAGILFMPKQSYFLNWLLAGGWFIWTVFVGIVFSVHCMSWLLRWLGVALVVFVGLLLLIQGELFSPFTLYILSFSLWASFALWTFSGCFGVQMLPGALASVLLGLSTQLQPMWVFLSLGIIMSTLPVLGWDRCRKYLTPKLAHCVIVELDNPAKGAQKTLRTMASLMLGSTFAADLMQAYPSQPRLLKAFKFWLQPWLGLKGWKICLRNTLNALPWEERGVLQEDTNVKVLSRLENAETFSVEKRIKILHAQFCFKGFSKSDMEMLANFLEVVEYHEDGDLLVQGEDAHPYLEIIIKGRVILERRRPGGNNSILAELGPMESLRAEDLFKSNPYDFSARALENVVTVRLYRQHLLAWSSHNAERMKLMIESVNLADMIMKLSLFRDFSPSQVRLVMEKLKKKEVAAGVDIITQGEEGDDFFLLDKGRVDIIIHGKTVAQLGSGSYFGEIALLEKCKRTATVRSSEKSILYSLQQSDFDRFFAAGRGAQVLKNVSSLRSGEAVI